MKEFFRSRGFKMLLAAVILLFGVVLYTASIGGFSSLTGSVAGGVLTPLQDLTANGSQAAGELLDNLTDDPAQLREAISQLQAQLDEKNSQLVDYYEIKRQNEQYKQYLDIKDQNPDFEFVSATVIGRDPNELFYGFTINKGSLAGVSLNDPVITSSGLIGKVTSLGATYAKVTTILSPSLNVGAICSRTSESGVITGNLTLADQGKTAMNFLDPDITLQEGDLIVTSGLGAVFPAGLILGEVREVRQGDKDISLTAVIDTAVDIPSVTDVFVISSFSGQGDVIEGITSGD